MRIVVHPVEPAIARRRLDRRAIDFEQRTQQRGASRLPYRHAGEPGDAGAAHQLQQQRLGLVVAMVRERDRVSAALSKRGVARFARGALDAESGVARDAHAHHFDRHAAAHAQCDAMLGPLIGGRIQSVVDVQCAQFERARAGKVGERIEQHHRIDAAREPDDESRSRQARARGRRPRRTRRPHLTSASLNLP